ncbi:MAG TPA: hypothetical protein PKD79_03410 [Candidatus Doudnabacteria bacterium]|nr:hypothetical protein [Candidatus Doudnabacteria bacterium]
MLVIGVLILFVIALVVGAITTYLYLYRLYLHRQYIDSSLRKIINGSCGKKIPLGSRSAEVLTELKFQLRGHPIKVKLYRDQQGWIYYDKSE